MQASSQGAVQDEQSSSLKKDGAALSFSKSSARIPRAGSSAFGQATVQGASLHNRHRETSLMTLIIIIGAFANVHIFGQSRNKQGRIISGPKRTQLLECFRLRLQSFWRRIQCGFDSGISGEICAKSLKICKIAEKMKKKAAEMNSHYSNVCTDESYMETSH